MPALADRISARVQDEVEEVACLNAPEIWEAHRRVTVASRLTHSRHLRNGRALPERLFDADLEAVRLAVHGGISISGLVHGYRIGHDVSLEAWLNSVEPVEAPMAEREACVRAIVRFAIDYNDRLADLLAAEYDAENARARTVRISGSAG